MTIYEMLSSGIVQVGACYYHQFNPRHIFTSRNKAIHNAYNYYRTRLDLPSFIRATEEV